MDRLPDLAAGLVHLRADVIVAGANAAVAAAKAVTRTIPIVMFLTVDPVGSGLVASLARPGGNVTGLTTTVRPENLRQATATAQGRLPPSLASRGTGESSRSSLYAYLARDRSCDPCPGVAATVMEIRSPGDFDNAFAAMTTAHVNAIFIPADSMFYQHRTRLAQLAANTRLPAMWGLREQAESDGLLAYATDLNDLARRAATYVDKILKGAKPADLPFSSRRSSSWYQHEDRQGSRADDSAVAVPRADQVIE